MKMLKDEGMHFKPGGRGVLKFVLGKVVGEMSLILIWFGEGSSVVF